MMKKLFCLLLCLLMLVSVLAACSNVPSGNAGDDPAGDNGGGNTDGDPSKDSDATATRRFTMFHSAIAEYEVDSQGRLIKVWNVNEFLDRDPDEESAIMGFVYGEDGKLSAVCNSGTEEPISYEGETPMLDGEMALRLEYHDNGSIKTFELVEYKSGYTFDQTGRMTSMVMPAAPPSEEDASADIDPELLGKAVYTFTYEGNKATLTVMVNGELYAESLEVEFDAVGYPVNMVVSSEGASEMSYAWKWENDLMMKMTMRMSREQEGQTVTNVREVNMTYDEKGNRTRMERLTNGELDGATVYTYDANGLMLTEKSLDENGAEEYVMEYYYDNGVYTGKKKTYSTENMESYMVLWCEYNADGDLIAEAERLAYPDGEYVITETKYQAAEVPEGALYDEIRYVQETRYRANGEVVKASECKVVYWSDEFWNPVDEVTGEMLHRDGESQQDAYGNYTDMETNEIYYFQKYIDANGKLFYYTADGVKTPLTAN